MKVRGIDVSRYQGNIDFNAVKASGIKFVIIQAGYGRYISQKDPWFESNYKRAKAAGLDVGVYWYSYAKSASEALQEAEVCLQAIKGKQFEYPVYLDIEERSQFACGKTICSQIVEAFCERLQNAGYFAGWYTYRAAIPYFTDSVQKKYTLWIAEYANSCAYKGAGVVDIWQDTSSLRVAGINGNVDANYCYRDFPAIIKDGGFNGFPKPVKKKPEVKTEEKKVDAKKTDVKKTEVSEKKTEEKKKPTDEVKSDAFMRGDVNGDGKINVTDVVKLAAHIKGKKLL